MKLVVFCLFAVFYSSLAVPLPNTYDKILQRKKLEEILTLVDAVKMNLQNSKQLLSTPPQNTEDCCSLSALECFLANLEKLFITSERNQTLLYRSLKNSITRTALNFGNSGNANSTCPDCASHPKTSAKEFFERLRIFIQKGIDRLSMN